MLHIVVARCCTFICRIYLPLITARGNWLGAVLHMPYTWLCVNNLVIYTGQRGSRRAVYITRVTELHSHDALNMTPLNIQYDQPMNRATKYEALSTTNRVRSGIELSYEEHRSMLRRAQRGWTMDCGTLAAGGRDTLKSRVVGSGSGSAIPLALRTLLLILSILMITSCGPIRAGDLCGSCDERSTHV